MVVGGELGATRIHSSMMLTHSLNRGFIATTQAQSAWSGLYSRPRVRWGPNPSCLLVLRFYTTVVVWAADSQPGRHLGKSRPSTSSAFNHMCSRTPGQV